MVVCGHTSWQIWQYLCWNILRWEMCSQTGANEVEYISQSFRTPRAFLVCFCEVPSAVTKHHWLSHPSASALRPHGEASLVTVTLHNTAPKGTADVSTDGPWPESHPTLCCYWNSVVQMALQTKIQWCLLKISHHEKSQTYHQYHRHYFPIPSWNRTRQCLVCRLPLLWQCDITKKGSLILSPEYSMHFDGSNWLFASFILKPRFLTWFNTILESVVTCFCEWEHTR